MSDSREHAPPPPGDPSPTGHHRPIGPHGLPVDEHGREFDARHQDLPGHPHRRATDQMPAWYSDQPAIVRMLMQLGAVGIMFVVFYQTNKAKDAQLISQFEYTREIVKSRDDGAREDRAMFREELKAMRTEMQADRQENRASRDEMRATAQAMTRAVEILTRAAERTERAVAGQAKPPDEQAAGLVVPPRPPGE